jgi:hypothetical protein
MRLSSPSDDSISGRRCVCSRVRTTSCGYVTTDAVIFAAAEHSRIDWFESGPCVRPSASSSSSQHRGCTGETGEGKHARAQILSCSYSGNCTATCEMPRRLGTRPR